MLACLSLYAQKYFKHSAIIFFMQELYDELHAEVVKREIHSKEAFLKLKDELVRKYHVKHVPSMISVLTHLPEFERSRYKFLLSKPTRTSSGVAPVAIMTKPMNCPPQARCTYCPGGPESFFGDVPKSYTGNEPASIRAARNHFSAYSQVMNRLEQYALLNQSFQKVELIIMGGTFMSYPKVYQDMFIMEALQAMNDFSEWFFVNQELNFPKFLEFFELPADVKNKDRTERILNKLHSVKKQTSLLLEQEKNEVASVRCVTLVIETRPDCSSEGDIDQMLALGTTRVELGIQSLSDEVLQKVERGHDVASSIHASQLLRDSFMKVCHQVMPGLYMDVDESIRMIQELFSNPDFRPDALKIYPCMVMPGTKLHEEYNAGRFVPLSTEEAGEVILKAKKFIPKYCRVMRIQRDIPTKVTIDGVGMTNFRQYVHELMKRNNVVCNCIRCREPRFRPIDWNHVELQKIEYEANHGTEVFLSYDDLKNNILLGFVRLRASFKPFRPEITSNTLGIRELHVYGAAASLGTQGMIQHRGLGKKLMEEAEKIAKEEFNAKKLAVISGIGVREYYYKLGYKRDGPYVSKLLE